MNMTMTDTALTLPDAQTLKQFDLRNICLHEAAHAVMARHFGADSNVYIRANSSGSCGLDGAKLYLGSTTIIPRIIMHEDGLTGHEAPLDADARRIIGLAGAVAEALSTDPLASCYELMDWIDEGDTSFSATDAAFAADFTLDDVQTCIDLVQALWPEIVALAKDEASWFDDETPIADAVWDDLAGEQFD